MANLTEEMEQLARSFGIVTRYWSIDGKQMTAGTEALLRVLHSLGSPVQKPADVPGALRQRRRQLWERHLEPVLVAWDGRPPEVELRLPANQAHLPRQFSLALDNGPTYQWSMKPSDLPVNREEDVEGVRYTARRLNLIGPYPLGYHRLTIEHDSDRWECLLIAAPERIREPSGDRYWGVFLPLYALHQKNSWGAGDFADLEDLVGWAQAQGGGLVATLPLLANFLKEPLFEPSPYSPASRLFWNEFYINLARVPELEQSSLAKDLLAGKDFQESIRGLQAKPEVDYARQMALKRQVLEACARELLAGSSPRRQAFQEHVKGHPRLSDYAAFRAACEQQQRSWLSWPERQKNGTLQEGDFDPDVQHYHMYVQWVADQQLQALAEKARAGGPGLYLDLPLGVNTDGYDVWRERDIFALGNSAGAPPDDFFAGGQNWGFPPVHPEKIREQGYSYLRAYLRHHMSRAGILRIDHMMGLHRLFWIPESMGAREGIYVGYQAEEQYAVFALEAQRQQVVLVGEDLGTVPEELPHMMARHNFHRMYVLPFQARPDPNQALAPIFEGAVSSLNTHDLAPFAAFWEGTDIKDRVRLKLLDPATGEKALKRRQEDCRLIEGYLKHLGLLQKPRDRQDVFRACLAFLCRGPSRVVLANLEDFWLEVNPQNIPGTHREVPNWRRRARHSLEEIKAMPAILKALAEMDRLVKQKS